jgi:hypothetical protein
VFIKDVFLVIYATVARFNVQPWFATDRKRTNELNGALMVGLLQIFIINDIYILSTHIFDLSYPDNISAPIIVSTIIVLLNIWWIIYLGEGKKFGGRLATMSRQYANYIKICASLLVIVAMIGIFTLSPKIPS